MKKWLALLLCLIMALSMLPAAIAEQDAPEEEPEALAPVEQAPQEAFDAPEEEPLAEETEELTPKGDIQVSAGNFPDANFRDWIKANITGGSSTLTQAQMDAVTIIDVSSEHIANLKGISRFRNLDCLYCSDNQLTELDLTGNKKLTEVSCTENQLTKISVSSCTELAILDAGSNKLTSINLSYNKKLKHVLLNGNRLTKLNVDNNPALEILHIEDNNLSSLRLTNNTALKSLQLANNPSLKSLDLSKNTALESAYLNKTGITSINVANCANLIDLDVTYTGITSLDVSKNKKLTRLFSNYTELKTLNVSNNPALQMLEVQSNNLSALNLSNNTDLRALKCSGNSIKNLDVSACPLLYTLYACENGIQKIDLSKNTNIAYLDLWANCLTELDVSKMPNLLELNCGDNYLSSLNVTKNTKLNYLDCGNNQIAYLNLSYNPELYTLFCQGNRLQFLNVGGCTKLYRLECQGNHLRALHLENNSDLDDLTMSPQNSTDALNYTLSGGKYTYNMRGLFETGSEASHVKPYDSTYSYNTSTGVMTMPGNVSTLKYRYDTGAGEMVVVVRRYYTGTFTVAFSESAVEYKGTTPYVIYNGTERRPDFVVRDSNGKWIDPEDGYFDYWYVSNKTPGTGWLYIRMYGGTTEKSLWFKIYMPPTTKTTVENISTGIWLTWEPVEDAKGYVIYRRAWNLVDGGWTDFQRWNNTTDTEWLDEKVYAGTRYQYGIKAYYNDPMDNYNLGIVGPLKTTVRITTRTLNSVTGGSKQITAKWSGSSVFTGYEVQIATDYSFTQNVKTVKIGKASTYQTTIKDLKANTTYWVRVRSYHIFEGTTYYGGWSNRMSGKTK